MKRPIRIIFALTLFAPASTGAMGFLSLEHGAIGTAMANARTALSDDISSLFYNPAAITELPGLQLQFGTTGILPTVSYSAAGRPTNPRTYTRFHTGEEIIVNDGENDTDAKLRGFTPIHLHAAYQIHSSGIHAGFSVYNPLGLGLFWPGEWDGRFIITESQMTTFFLQPVVALDVAKLGGFKDSFKLSLAFGMEFVPATAGLAKRIDLRIAEVLPFEQAVVGPEGGMKLSGTAFGIGWIASLYAEIPDLVAVGASFRGGFSDGGVMPLDFSGKADFWFNNAGQQAKTMLNLRIPDRVDGSVTVKTPLMMNFGIALLAIDRLKVDLDFFYVFYSSYDELKVKFDCEDCTLPIQTMVNDWDNAWVVSLGAEYLVLDNLAVRAGYQYVTTPVPDHTLDPSLPEASHGNYSAGVGYIADWWKLDLSYMISIYQRVKDNDVGSGDTDGNPNGLALGTYNGVAHIAAVSFSVKL